MLKERLPTLSIRYIRSYKLRKTNFIGLLDDFVVKKTRTKPFYEMLTVLCSAYLIR